MATGLICLLAPLGLPAAAVSFNRDVRPILSENCFHCHGADEKKRKGKLRLDTAAGARKEGVIVAGKPDESELIKRILTENADDQMPPPDSHRKLSPAQKGILKRWVAEGAKYEAHWAFVTPVRAPLPPVKMTGWASTAIDRFVLAKLEAEGLAPMPPAPLEQLLRRVSFDLVGLPPTAEQIKRWSSLSDPVGGAADELLASPQFGERMAVDWMDVARYADTHGFNNDSSRSMWRWRDWVIEAFNRNIPYNQFITEQLAGDLIERPTMEQLIATGFNRNHVINSEGGIIDEEYRVEYVADRVRTTSMAWLGLTTECARCHDHKFDPISQRDYFRLFAFFNNVDEHGEDGRVANASPMISSPTVSQRKGMAEARGEALEAERAIGRAMGKIDWQTIDFRKFAETLPRVSPEATNMIVSLGLTASETPGQLVSNAVAKSKPFKAIVDVEFAEGPGGHKAMRFDGTNFLKTEGLPKNESGKGWAFAAWVRRDGAGEAPIFSTASFNVPESSQSYGQGVEIRLNEHGEIDVRLAIRWPAYSINVISRETLSTGEWRHVLVTRDGSPWARGVRIFVDGEEVGRDVLHDNTQSPVSLSGAAFIGASADKRSRSFVGALADVRVIAAPFKVDQLAEWARVEALRAGASKQPNALARSGWLEHHDASVAGEMTRKRAAIANLLEIEREAPTTMIMRELTNQRSTHVLFRGEYDKPREQVDAGVPEFLLSFADDLPRNRLGLARWLTSSQHPLTARVVVNRFWQSVFGNGIVKSAEDFGLQSDWPSHPELLDWLAVDFVESGWNVKQLLKRIVTSATYRQDSRSTPALAERDPENRLLARGPRFRLPAEMIRDQALAISGLLHQQVGGPPVFPYQPTNLYKGIVVAADYPGTSYTESKGHDLYRRSMYTFWKRTVPHPTLATFDASDREVCVARRLKTNTPLQALGLMNDRIQLEAAGRFAQRILKHGGSDQNDRIAFAFRTATARDPHAEEVRQVSRLLNQRLEHYRNAPAEAKSYLGAIGANVAEENDASELAAYANIASLILNLDETVTKN